MEIKITSPTDMGIHTFPLEIIVGALEEDLRSKPRNLMVYNISAHIRSTEADRREIVKLYKEAGWVDVYCKTVNEYVLHVFLSMTPSVLQR